WGGTATVDARLRRLDAAHASSSRRTFRFRATLPKTSAGSARKRGSVTRRAWHLAMPSSRRSTEDRGRAARHVSDHDLAREETTMSSEEQRAEGGGRRR